MAKKLKIKTSELVCYIIGGAVALWGLVYLILGLIANSLPVPLEDNPLKQASNVIKKYFGLDFFGWGIIIFVIGVLFILIVLCVRAKTADKSFEKQQRRAARVNRNTFGGDEVVEAEASEPIEEPKAE